MFLPKGLVRIRHFGLFATADEQLCSHSAAHCSVRLLLPLSISRRSNSALFAQVLMVLVERLTAYQLHLRSTPVRSAQPAPSDSS